MTIFPSTGRSLPPLKTAGASSSDIRVIGGAAMLRVTTASSALPDYLAAYNTY